ncbi:MAG: acetyl-CoA hydrolase/transferase family protein [Anaerovoracaceae bacterium]
MDDPKKLYQQKLMTPDQIADQIQDGWRLCTDLAAAIPTAIVKALAKRLEAGGVKDVYLDTSLDIGQYSCFTDEVLKNLTPVTWFSGKELANEVNRGQADALPCYYRDMPQLHEKFFDTDALIANVSPMDKHGYFSTGTSASYSQVVADKAKHIYLEVNPGMPRVASGPMIHISQVTGVCESTEPMPILPKTKIDDVSKTIGGIMAEEVPNGATIQMGIGAVPEAFGLALLDKRDLGIHTELFTDSMVEMIEKGAVTNMEKPMYRGRSVATLAFGSQRVYDYMDDNPAFVMLPVSFVNDPAVIAQHPNFISVNAALEVDFYGQVCAESLGTKHISGTGGQADYVRGATQSKGGKSFIAFPSTAAHGKVSRIKSTLSPGAIVSTHKNDVDNIVTEYGIAPLRGRTLSQRVKNLIAIAHPDFRDQLRFEAKKENILI